MGTCRTPLILLLFVSLLFFACSSTTTLSNALVLVEQKKYDEAIELYKKDPHDEKLLYNLALLYIELDNNNEALATLQRLNELSDFSNLWYLKALEAVASRADNSDLVEKTLVQIITLDPYEKSARERLVSLLEDQERYKEAYQRELEEFNLKLYSKKLFANLSRLQELAKEGDGSVWSSLEKSY